MRCVLCLLIVLFASARSGPSDCSEYDFPCEDGECVDSGLWCDTIKDCEDGSDEKYCKTSSNLDKDPNNCPSTYFRCGDGPCIPLVGVCDEYGHCRDSSDEFNCQGANSSSAEVETTEASTHVTTPLVVTGSTPVTTSSAITMNTTAIAEASVSTMLATTHQTPVKAEESLLNYLSDASDAIPVVYSELHHSDYPHQREKARDWLLSQRRQDFGWGDETSRAVTALFLSDVEGSAKRNENYLLMVKQLEVQLSLGMARNSTKPMELSDLALYLNALSASCKDPKNFYGENLVRTLRNSADTAQMQGKFVNPSVYLTLCLNNVTTYEDTRRLHELFTNGKSAIRRTDIQALVLLTLTCIHRNTEYLSASLFDSIKRQFLRSVNASGLPGNVYEATLILQALHESKKSLPGLLELILASQEEDGSFGGILATYLVLPVLAGRSFLQMNDHCSQRYSTDPAPLEVLQNMKRKKIYIQYSLSYDYPPEITETLQMQVAEGIGFLDVMRLAQEINPKYRFLLDDNREVPLVYSIGGIPNDPEKGIFWTLHVASSSNAVKSGTERLSPYPGNIKELMPHNGDEFVFRLRTI